MELGPAGLGKCSTVGAVAGPTPFGSGRAQMISVSRPLERGAPNLKCFSLRLHTLGCLRPKHRAYVIAEYSEEPIGRSLRLLQIAVDAIARTTGRWRRCPAGCGIPRSWRRPWSRRKQTTPNAVMKAFIAVSFMNQTVVNRIDLATITAFEEILCEA